jgi:uncharacterized RDD family membrane protein YckC
MICRNHVEVAEGVRRCDRCGGPFCGDCLVTLGSQTLCGDCKHERLLDVRSGIDYGGGLRLASIGRRIGALAVDYFLLWVLLMICMFSLALAVKAADDSLVYGVVLILLGGVVSFVTYEGLMLSARGQTLGKIAFRIRVVQTDGSPLSAGQAWGRAAMRMIMIHLLSIVDDVCAVATAERTTIHDMVARTRVVNVE